MKREALNESVIDFSPFFNAFSLISLLTLREYAKPSFLPHTYITFFPSKNRCLISSRCGYVRQPCAVKSKDHRKQDEIHRADVPRTLRIRSCIRSLAKERGGERVRKEKKREKLKRQRRLSLACSSRLPALVILAPPGTHAQRACEPNLRFAGGGGGG